MGTAHLRPRVPHDRSRGRRARRVSGDVSPRISRAPRVSGPGQVLIVVVSDRAQSVPRLGAARAAHASRAGARGRRSRGTGGGRRTIGIDRRSGGAQRLVARRRTRDDAAARGTADGNRAEGVSRADVPGDRGSGGLPAEYREDSLVPGPQRAAARARRRRPGLVGDDGSLGTGAPAEEPRGRSVRVMTDTCTTLIDRDEMLVGYLYGDTDAESRAAFEAHMASCVVCRDEMRSLQGVRQTLARWSPPERDLLSSRTANDERRSANDERRTAWWRAVPAWAQVA